MKKRDGELKELKDAFTSFFSLSLKLYPLRALLSFTLIH